ncbi:auxin response factor, partial [Tanacetum coccineum]
MEDPPNHFFKLIPPGFNFNLSIPKSFWINLKEETCKKAVLKRGRREWPVSISDKGVFGGGWRKLMIDNGVQEFDFIVFKHQGKMLFDFMVFDQSSCERQYPNLRDEIDVEDHIHERSKKSKKRKRNDYSSRKEDKSHLGGDSCFKIIMTSFNIESSRLNIPIKFARSNGLITEDTQNKVVHTKAVIVDEAQRTWPATLQTNRQVLLGGWRELKIQNHLKAGDSCIFELVKLGEVSVFSFYKLGKKPVRDDDHIQVQKDTVVNFSLNVDRTMDVEELLRGSDSVQKLTSLDALDVEEPLTGSNSNYTDRKKPVENNSQAEVEIDSTKKETSSTLKSHPYFTSTLNHKRITKAGLYLPVEFSISNGLKLGEIILRYDNHGSWNVQLVKHSEKTFKLRRGFKDFCVENGLEEGNVYKFEIVEDQKDNPPVMNVSLYEDLARGNKNYQYFLGEVKSYVVEKMLVVHPCGGTPEAGQQKWDIKGRTFFIVRFRSDPSFLQSKDFMGDSEWFEVRNKNRKSTAFQRNGGGFKDNGWNVNNMGKYRTKEDDVARISTSVYVSNIQDSITAKDLFQACKQYGHVVDTFIPTKRDKNGKRFGFVRFINVFNEDRLINNLCTVWIDRLKLHANIARFQRTQANFNEKEGKLNKPQSAPKVILKSNVPKGDGKSYMGVLKGDINPVVEEPKSEPVLVLGDDCMATKDVSNALFGRVKEFASLANLKLALTEEGFVDLSIKYLGELWVMLEFKTKESKNKFNDNISVAAWFSLITEASLDFMVEGRIAWVEVEGIPLKLWS